MFLVILFVRILQASSFNFTSIKRDFGFIESLKFNGSETTVQHVPIQFPYHLYTYSQQFNPSTGRQHKMKQIEEHNMDDTNTMNITISIEVTRKFKKIINQDDRKKVLDASVFPWSAIGKLRVQDCVDSNGHICSAVLIAPNVALTSAHCVRRKQEWCKSVWFTTSQSFGSSLLKLDGASPKEIDVLSCWDQGDLNCDLALLRLDWSIGCSAGYMSYGYDCRSSITKELKVAGFPQDEHQPNNDMYYSSCYSVSMKSCFNMNRTTHDCDTGIGMSGSPLWSEETDISGETQYYIRAINRGAKTWRPLNVAPKISVQVYQWIKFITGDGNQPSCI